MRQNEELRAYCIEAKRQMEADHASKQLMDAENQRLRNRLFDKTTKPTRRKEGGSSARHMTSQENIIALAKDIWKGAMADVLKELTERQKARDGKRKALVKVLEPLVKKIGGKQKAALKELEAERQREEKERKAMEQARKKAEAEARKQCAKEQKAAQKAAKDAEKAAKQAEKAVKQAGKALQLKKRASRKRKADELTVDENTDPTIDESPNKQPRPRPRPYVRPVSPEVLVPTTTDGPMELSNNVAARQPLAPSNTTANNDLLHRDGNVLWAGANNVMVIDPALQDQ